MFSNNCCWKLENIEMTGSMGTKWDKNVFNKHLLVQSQQLKY